MVVQFPYHGPVERQLAARCYHGSFQVLSCKLLESLQLLCLCDPGIGGEHVKTALLGSYLRVEAEPAAFAVIQLPRDRVEGTLDHFLYLCPVQTGFLQDKLDFLVVQ